MIKFKDNYDTSVIVSTKIINNELVLIIDFNIKSYLVLKKGLGWKEFDFPNNIKIDDKLYLNKKMKNKIINILKFFIVAEYVTGEQQNDFLDVNNANVSIQNSSSVEPNIWFGRLIKKDSILYNGKNFKFEILDGEDSVLHDRLHLNQELAKDFIKCINKVWQHGLLENKINKLIVNENINEKISKI